MKARVANSLAHQRQKHSIPGSVFQVNTAVPSRTHKEAAVLQSRILRGALFHLLQAQRSTLMAHLCEAKQTCCSMVRSSKWVAYLYTHRKPLGRIGAISLAIAAIVGIATIRNTREVSVVTAVATQPEITQAAKAEARAASKPTTDPKVPTPPLTGDFGFSLESAEQSIPARPSIKVKEPLATAKPESIPSPPQPAVAEAPRPSPEPTAARKEFVEIAVELKIEDGRVAEAHIGNRQRGAEAFEATALHIARQRRYPPGTSRTETLVLRVANQFGRKEP
jgi:hypothetical protein